MRYDVILFDLDGTLTESAPGITNVVRFALDAMGYKDYDPSILPQFIGPSLHGSFQQHFGMSGAQAEEAVGRYRVYFEETGIFENAVYLGIPNLLRRLQASGARLFVATAKPDAFMRRILDRFGLSRFFEGVLGATMDERGGDKAQIIRGVLPGDQRRAVMIGDRRYDIEGGRANGIDTIGVCYGYGSRQELREAGATHIVDSVAELSDYLAGDTPTPQGFFLTVEGLDGCGKTTQIDRLAAHLEQIGYQTLRTREPGGSAIAEKIRELVLTPTNLGMHAWTESLLYAAARAEHVNAVVRPALTQGKVVLCDRYVDSSIAFQGAGRELGVQKVQEINDIATGGLQPDLTLYLRLDATTSLARRSSATSLDRIEMENATFHQRVFDGYEHLAEQHAHRIRPVDASRSVEEIAQAACAEVDSALAKR